MRHEMYDFILKICWTTEFIKLIIIFINGKADENWSRVLIVQNLFIGSK